MSETTRCTFCQVERPKSELKSGTIIFRNRRPGGKAFVDRKTNLYCADKPCHAHDQMAHEG